MLLSRCRGREAQAESGAEAETLMGEAEALRRKLAGEQPKRPLSVRAATYVRLLENSLRSAEEVQGKSERVSGALAQNVLHAAFKSIEPHISGSGQLSGRQRLEWVTEFLFSSGVFPTEMLELTLALEALDRGETLPLFEPKKGGRRGGTRSTTERFGMRMAVEAARELKAISGKTEAYRAELAACGTSARTIAGYEKKLASTVLEPRNRATFLWAFGDRDPREVLREALTLLPKRRTRV
jgi:hypothetical protein